MRKKLLASAFFGFSLPVSAVADAPSVAVDIAPVHSLVSQVMEGVGQPNLLIPAEASPHGYSLRPSQAKALSNAEVVFWMGESFTPWLDKAMDNVAESAYKVEMLELPGTTTHNYREGATFEEHAHHEEGEHEAHDQHENNEHKHHDEHAHKDEDHNQHDDHESGFLDRFLSLISFKDTHDHHDEEHHDEHNHHNEDHHDHHDHDGVDPHAWLDPDNAKLWLNEISEVLSKHDPENAAIYASNAEKARASLDKLINETQTQINSLGELKFIVFHDAYQYFEKRFGISATGSISLGDAEDPSPARIKEIQNTVKELGVNCVFTEPQYNAGIVENVFEGSSISAIGVMDPLGASLEEGSEHYTKLIEGMVSSLSQCNK